MGNYRYIALAARAVRQWEHHAGTPCRVRTRRRNPCKHGAHDRTHRCRPHHTPCNSCGDGHARRCRPRRTPCSCSACDRARTIWPRRTRCSRGARMAASGTTARSAAGAASVSMASITGTGTHRSAGVRPPVLCGCSDARSGGSILLLHCAHGVSSRARTIATRHRRRRVDGDW